MRQVNLRQLRTNLTKELDDLPVEIVSRGETVGFIVKQLDNVKHPEPKMLNILPVRADPPVRDLSKSAQASGKMSSNCVGK